MSMFRGILLGTLVLLALGAVTTADAAVSYDAILEWNGPYFRVVNSGGIDQLVDDPATDAPFELPYAVAAREHGTGQRDVVYVLDEGHNRIQAFEVNAGYYTDDAFTWTTPAAAASQFDDNEIRLAQWAGAAARWILPHSETLAINGETWSWVANITGMTAADKVYTVDYDVAAGPIINLPNNSLTQTATIRVTYALSDNYTAAADAFGLGDVDYGTGAGATPVLTKISETSGGPTSFQLLRSIALIPNEATATSDDIFVIDAADNSANQNEELFYYTVAVDGTVAYGEAYDDVLTNPYDVAVANGGPTEGAATASVDAIGTIVTAVTVRDASQVTGHRYTVTGGANVTEKGRGEGKEKVRRIGDR